MISVHFNGKDFEVKCPPFDAERIKGAPDRKWNKKTNTWHVPATRAGAMYLGQNYSDSEKTNEARAKIKQLKEIKRAESYFPAWFKFKNEPMRHQMEALNQTWGNNEIGLFMEMRTGKTFVAINWAAALAMSGEINGMLVIVPNSITLVWEDQLDEHCPIPVHSHVVRAGDKTRTQRFIEDTTTEGFKVLIVGVEALSQGTAWKYVQSFCSTHQIATVVDESSRIKNATSTRTKRVIDFGGGSKYRAILTGTPVTQGIQDLFAQFKFLNWKIIGVKSEYAFKARYCIMGGFENRKVIGYRNIGEIIENTKPYIYQCQAKDVLDLPDKVYEMRLVEPNKTQVRLFKELGDPFLMATNIDDKILEAETVLERMIRYQQIAGGVFPYSNEDGGYDWQFIPDKNAKMNAMVEDIGDLPRGTKVIIWAVFRPEIEVIVDHLVQEFGHEAVAQFHGGVDNEQRKVNVHRFQNNSECLFFVANKAASMGLELSAASVHLFYSRSFSYEDNIQAEARTNSKNQKANSILYIDYRINHKIDKDIAKALKMKKSMADYVTGEMEK